MEKSIFFFRKHPNRTTENFAHHYINNHAPLGKKLTQGLRGYTVNIVDGDGFPAAVTEHWVVPDVMHLLTPAQAYKSMEDFQQVLADDQSLFSGFELYVVIGENIIVDGTQIDSALEQRTPGIKLIQTFADADNVPPPFPRACRVVDNLVAHQLVMTDSYDWEKVESAARIIRMSWFADMESVGEDTGDALRASEYCFIGAPSSWEAS